MNASTYKIYVFLRIVLYQKNPNIAFGFFFANMRLHLLFIMICLSATTVAQEKWFWKRIHYRAQYDSNYVVSYYDHHLHVTAISLLQNQDLRINTPGNNPIVNYKANNVFTWGLGVDYRYFSIELSKAFEAFDKQDARKGESSGYRFRLGITGRRFLASALIWSNKGVYMSNSNEVIPGWQQTNEPYYKRRDITTNVLFGSLYYIFNHQRYSTMASLWQIDRQKKSAGSFIAGISACANEVRGDSALLPLLPYMTDANMRITKAKTAFGGINIGYAHNFIFAKKFFINAMVIPGIDWVIGSYQNINGVSRKNRSSIGYHGDFRVMGGYNGEAYYSGVLYSNYFLNNRFDNRIDMGVFNGYLRLFIGKRFDLTPRKKIQKG